jgi:hypothetical protein
MKNMLQNCVWLYLISRDNILRLLYKRTHKIIYEKKKKQINRFKLLAVEFVDNYKLIGKKNLKKFVTRHWSNYNLTFEKICIPEPPFDFLRNPQIMFSMFMTAGGAGLKREISYLEKRFSRIRLKRILQEDCVGNPLIINKRYLSSRNSISHLTVIARFLETTKCKLEEVNTIIEWGGGYGDHAKIFTRLKNTQTTYILIDTPLFSCLQYLYLGTIFGMDKVNLIKNAETKIEPKKFNLLPVSLVEKYKLVGEVFVSTWALSESSRYSQDYVFKRRWFGARNVLLAYQKANFNIPFAERVGTKAKLSGALVTEIKELPGNFYAFK